MKVFDEYSQYYDMLYRDKDYAGEAKYVHSLITEFKPEAKTIFEMGCGTGMHAACFADLGYTVTGIDRSTEMLRKAEERRRSTNSVVASRLSFCEGDVRSYVSDKRNEVAISLFHVMSYMQTATELEQALATANHHLLPGGIFIFDCWHGPAVLADRPISRRKEFENEQVHIERTSIPQMDEKLQRVDVHFDIVIGQKSSGVKKMLQEDHRMRYLFTEEIAELAKKNGLELIHSEEWLSRKPLSEKTWNACYVLKKAEDKG
jgi:SAM-dependent methyltransferase